MACALGVSSSAVVQAYSTWQADRALLFVMISAVVISVADFILRTTEVRWQVRWAIVIPCIVGVNMASRFAVVSP